MMTHQSMTTQVFLRLEERLLTPVVALEWPTIAVVHDHVLGDEGNSDHLATHSTLDFRQFVGAFAFIVDVTTMTCQTCSRLEECFHTSVGALKRFAGWIVHLHVLRNIRFDVIHAAHCACRWRRDFVHSTNVSTQVVSRSEERVGTAVLAVKWSPDRRVQCHVLMHAQSRHMSLANGALGQSDA